MKIRCILTDSTEYRQFNCYENGIYTLKISKKYEYWFYDLCDFIGFYADTDIDTVLDISTNDIVSAQNLYGNHKYNEQILRAYEPTVLVHSTTKDNAKSILKDGRIKSWNILKSEKGDWEDKPIGSLLGDIDDFSNYVMLSGVEQNNEIITASKMNGMINTDINQNYCAGARFYLDANTLAKDGKLIRDGAHLKVKDYIDLAKYMIWYATPKKVGLSEHTTPKEFFEISNKYFSEIAGKGNMLSF